MTEGNNDEISKLVIFGLGIAALTFFAYLVYKDRNKITIPRQLAMSSRQSELEKMELKLAQLETKLDNLSNTTKIQPMQAQSQPERTIVSMGRTRPQVNAVTKMRNTNTKELFGMR